MACQCEGIDHQVKTLRCEFRGLLKLLFLIYNVLGPLPPLEGYPGIDLCSRH